MTALQGGVTVDPNELSERELEILTRKLVQVGASCRCLICLFVVRLGKPPCTSIGGFPPLMSLNASLPAGEPDPHAAACTVALPCCGSVPALPQLCGGSATRHLPPPPSQGAAPHPGPRLKASPCAECALQSPVFHSPSFPPTTHPLPSGAAPHSGHL